ncbi:glycoside hydrolase family 20 zincin-like fold domain-containing protein, partial [Streptomyces sp. SID3915]|uniref:glycoside hydrolase family 20 zincin-like fold domain-containing protein n=5 Tax=Streptomyces TaxID=1883 RepID=UPI00136E3BAD
APDRTGASRSPAVWPRPQSLRTTGRPLVLGAEATLLADAGADPYAVDELRDLLRGAGVRTVHEALPGGGPVFRLGGAG